MEFHYLISFDETSVKNVFIWLPLFEIPYCKFTSQKISYSHSYLTLHLFGKNTTEVHWASNFMVTTRPPVVGPKGWKLWNLKEWTL